jgi:hypothetical protein
MKSALVVLIFVFGVIPAAMGLWTLLTRHYMVTAGRPAWKLERVQISPQRRPYLFGIVAAVHAAGLGISLTGIYFLIVGA